VGACECACGVHVSECVSLLAQMIVRANVWVHVDVCVCGCM
jgi:hypothetical protein